MNNKAKGILQIERTYGTQTPNPRVDKLQSKMGEMKKILPQIQQEMKVMSGANKTKQMETPSTLLSKAPIPLAR